ncbi:T9SS type B sorting domain-containing protein [Maribacter arcticus]|uniref:T9SS type B sorting domain-containing protein n=1 Tax=Maribacter arcticus TaxID=561365 RepID=UPI0030017E27
MLHRTFYLALFFLVYSNTIGYAQDINCLLPTTITPVSSSICIGADAHFILKGNAGDIVNYILRPPVAATVPVTLDDTGNAIVTVPAITVNIAMQIRSVEDGISGCIDPTQSTATVRVNPLPLAPINPIEQIICEGNPNTPLSIELDHSGGGNTIYWYDSDTGGIPIGSGLTYTSLQTLPNTYTYYAEALESVYGCTSATRVPVNFTINPSISADVLTDQTACDSFTLPPLNINNFYYSGPGGTGNMLNAGDAITRSQTIYINAQSGTTPNCIDESSFDITIDSKPILNLISATCSTDLSTYTIQFINSSTSAILTTSAGTISGNSIIDIPSTIGLVTITADNNGCNANLSVIAPDCSCPVIAEPINPVNQVTCEATANSNLQVSLGSSGDTINWFDTATGGISIASGLKYSPTESMPGVYTYFAETSDSTTGCVSNNRTAVTLTIEEIPVADIMADVEGCEFYTLPTLSVNNRYFTGSNGTGQLLMEGSKINQSQTVYIYAQSQNVPTCSTESEFVITILEEPIIDLPNEISICIDENGVTSTTTIGIDLGPGFIYDWTPNNDTNGDGIEEAIFTISQVGEYSLKVYTIGNTIQCGGTLEYFVNVTNAPIPLSIDLEITAEGDQLNSGNRVRAIINNDMLAYSNFEYSLDNPDGPYQTENLFQNIPGGLHTIFVRALGSCGKVLESAPFLLVNYPTFFSPNGDGSNDTWIPLGLTYPGSTSNVVAEIYDRYGKLVHYLDIFGPGWDGTYYGSPLPESDYWFVINYTDVLDNDRTIQFNGHFSLIR